MDKIISARLAESAVSEMEQVTRRLGISKKRFLEEAIRLRARQLQADDETDVWSETVGAWKRKEKPQETVQTARAAFNQAFRRHQQAATR